MEKYNRAAQRVSCLHEVQPDAPTTCHGMSLHGVSPLRIW